MEGFVCRGENGDIGGVGEGGHLVGGVEGAFKGREVESIDSVGDVGGRNEEGVNYLNYTTAE